MERIKELAERLGVTIGHLVGDEDIVKNADERKLLEAARGVDPAILASAIALLLASKQAIAQAESGEIDPVK